MESKSWILQRNATENVIAVVQNLIDHLEVKVNKRYLYRKIKQHPDFPTILSISSFLNEINIKTLTVKIDFQKLKKVPLPAIAYFEKEIQFVMLYEIRENEVEYLHPGLGWIIEPYAKFIKKWNGVILFVTEVGETLSEHINFDDKNTNILSYQSDKIKLIDEFLTEEECDYLINLATPKFKPSKVTSEGKSVRSKIRTSFSTIFSNEDNDPIVNSVLLKASKLVGIPQSHTEFLQCTTYKKGQEYNQHYDTFSSSVDEVEKKGQRACTIIVYLNHDFKGGATHFPELNRSINPKKGLAVKFFLLNPFGETDPELLHAGLPVIEGQKFILNIWIREKVFQGRL